MALRTGHGTGKGVPRIEVMPADELPAGVPAPARQAADRDESGKLRPGPGTSELARKAAKARHESAAHERQMARLLGLRELPDGHPYAPYACLARDWRDGHMRELAATVGGGEVGPGPASIVSSAALQMAASRFLHDVGSDACDAKMLLDASRQNLLAAHELAAREAKARSPALPASLSFLDSTE